MANIEKVVKTEGLTHYYGDLCAVDHLNMIVGRGEFFALLGPNGSGKTTTIRLLSGLIRPKQGTAIIDGLDVVRSPLEVKARIGVVPERSNLYAELSARDNLVFVAQLYGLPRSQCYERADQLLVQFGLSEKVDALFATLSGGMKRRLTIAAALVHRPTILFLDEPTTGLDVQSARNLRTLVQTLHREGVTIFLTTHLIQEAERLAERVGILVKGKLIAVDTPAALCARCPSEMALEVVIEPSSEALQTDLRQSAHMRSFSRVGDAVHLGVISYTHALQEIATLAARHGAEIRAIRSITPSLEDAFVQMTGMDVAVLESNKPQSQGGPRA